MKNPTSKSRRSKDKKPSSNRSALIERKLPGRKFVEFPGMNGRVVEKIELFTMREYHSITVRFQDKTMLVLTLDLGFTLKAEHDDWKTGDARQLKIWPAILSQG